MEEFRGMEREHTHVAVLFHILHPEGMGGIVDNRDAVLFAETAEAVKVADIAVDMHGDNRFGDAGLDEFFGFRGIKAKGFWVDIGEYRFRADTHEGVASGDEGERSGYDFTASESHRLIPQFKRKRTIDEECHVGFWYAEITGKFALETVM